MRKYEVMYILRPDLEEEGVQSSLERYKAVIETGGSIVKAEIMGKRRLAYEIEKFREGIYVLINFESNTEVVAELDRVMKISDDVIRHLIVNDEAA